MVIWRSGTPWISKTKATSGLKIWHLMWCNFRCSKGTILWVNCHLNFKSSLFCQSNFTFISKSNIFSNFTLISKIPYTVLKPSFLLKGMSGFCPKTLLHSSISVLSMTLIQLLTFSCFPWNVNETRIYSFSVETLMLSDKWLLARVKWDYLVH